MSRRRYADERHQITAQIPASVLAPVELLLLNPLTGKPVHGSRSILITRLLREYLARREAGELSLSLFIAHSTSGTSQLIRAGSAATAAEDCTLPDITHVLPVPLQAGPLLTFLPAQAPEGATHPTDPRLRTGETT